MLAFDAPPTLDDVLAGRDTVVIEQRLDKGVSELRLQALKAVALQVGTQAGYQRRSYEIEQSITSQAPRLDQIYNFQGLLLDNNVVPPVLVEAKDIVRAPDDSTLRLADTTYEIVIQAKFATTTPSWRDYLVRGTATTPTTYKPDPVMQPRNDAERDYWKAQVAVGWEAGEKQAELVFSSELARLDRDYKGMIIYRHLLYRNMVSKPFVSQSNMGVTGDGNRIAINDRVLRIVAKPQLETRSEKWNAPVLPSNSTSSSAGGRANE